MSTKYGPYSIWPFIDMYSNQHKSDAKARSHRQNVAGAFLERWGMKGHKFWQRSSPRTKWQIKIENTGVALAAHRWGRRCFSVGLTVASGTERWFSDDASVDKNGVLRLRALVRRGFNVG